MPWLLSEAKQLSAEELKQGLDKLREVFPDIHQTVAELTLQVKANKSKVSK